MFFHDLDAPNYFILKNIFENNKLLSMAVTLTILLSILILYKHKHTVKIVSIWFVFFCEIAKRANGHSLL